MCGTARLSASAAVRASVKFTRTAHDVVLLDAAANRRARGAARVALHLYRCATTAWPRAAVGKADDDVWLHLPGISAHLRVAAHSAGTRPATADLVGVFQSFHWDVRVERPGAMQDVEIRVAQELRPRGQLAPRLITPRWRDAGGWWQHRRIGPFHFTRGPAYFVGAGIVRQLLDDVILQAHMRATLDAADVATNLSTTLPWEDVYTGLALSEAARGAGLAYVHVGCEVYSDGGVLRGPERADLAHAIEDCEPDPRAAGGRSAALRAAGPSGVRRRLELQRPALAPLRVAVRHRRPAAANGTAAAGGCSVGFANLFRTSCGSVEHVYVKTVGRVVCYVFTS